MNQRKVLFYKDFLLVVIGQIISLFGNGILRFAMPLYILEKSGSAALFGIVSACSFLPVVIMSPIGGILADRINKQRIMVILDFITAILISGFLVLSNQVAFIPLIIVTMMILYGIQGVYSPAVQASIPLLASEENLMPANAVVNLVQSLANLLGPVIGGILFGNFGLMPILYVSVGCFVFSAVLELFIQIPHTPAAEKEKVLIIVKKDIRESADFIFHSYPIMAKVVGLVFLINLFMSSMLMIGLPVTITGYLGLSSQLYGINQGALAAGGLIGGIMAGAVGKHLSIPKSWRLLLLAALGIIPMGIVLLLDVPSMAAFGVITIFSMLLMICTTLFSIQMLAFVQAKTPSHLVGKVISCVLAVSLCAQPIGQALFGLVFEKLADMPGIIMLAAAIISMIISILSKTAFKQLQKESQQPSEAVNK